MKIEFYSVMPNVDAKKEAFPSNGWIQALFKQA